MASISFDKTTITNGEIFVPEKYSEIFNLKTGSQMIAKGSGLSYCAASSGDHVLSIDMRKFNRIINFDDEQGFIEVETGMSIGELNNFLVTKNWILPALPGYPSITIGGCIAFNVHGKSQYKVGNFKDWIVSLNLFHITKGEMKCSEAENSDLFQYTIGGMGLTGIILSAKLKLRKLNGNLMSIQKIKVPNVYEAINLMYRESDNSDYIYAWNNLNIKGKGFGKGIVYLENHISSSEPKKTKKYINKLEFKSILPQMQNSLSVKLICSAYEIMNSLSPNVQKLNLTDSTFPIYGKEIYYYLFGNKGFREYQVIFPLENWEQAIQEIQKAIDDTKMPISLGSLKIFKGNAHYLSFSGNGVCIVLDVPNIEKSLLFFEKLDSITLENNGIVNLCKDSRISSEFAKKVFPEYNNFKAFINKFDSTSQYNSELKKRLQI